MMLKATSIPFFSLWLFNLLGASKAMDSCTTRSCNQSATFSVTLPFRIPQYQPDAQCSYSSDFDLSCSDRGQTLLHLPKSGSFSIENIDYTSRMVTLADPNGCLPRRYLNFDPSGSPFYWLSVLNGNYTYYNCTRTSATSYSSYDAVPCMSGKNYTVFSIYSGSARGEAMEKNCTVIKKYVSAPWSYSYWDTGMATSIDLYWSRESCGNFKGGSKCPDTSSEDSGLSGYQIVLILFLPVTFISMAVCACARARHVSLANEEPQVVNQLPETQTQLNQNQSGTGTSTTSLFGLTESAIDINPICPICLGEYKAGDTLRTIKSCNHYFHSHCGDEWLNMRDTCPVCRNGA